MNPKKYIEGVCNREHLFLPAGEGPEASWDASEVFSSKDGRTEKMENQEPITWELSAGI